jgi:hypothetical protein
MALLGLALLLPAIGCATVDDEPATAAATSDLTLTNPHYDPPRNSRLPDTLCTVDGTTMHCCPPGQAMIGVHVNDDRFKCATANLTGLVAADHGTTRSGIHTCPMGSVMVGLHVGQNVLACQQTNPPTTPAGEFVDFRSFDGYMHVCGASNAAMAGIQVNQNWLTCDE